MLTKQKELEDRYNRNQQYPKLLALLEESKVIEEYKANKLYYKWLRNFMIQMMIHKRLDIEAAIGLVSGELSIQMVALYIEVTVEAGLVVYESESDKLITAIVPDDNTQLDMAKYMFPPPLVVKPREVTDNSQTGYHFYNHGSVILRNAGFDKDICLDVINKLNSLELSVNERVLDNVSSIYKSLKSRKPKESLYDFNKRKRQWAKFDKQTRDLIQDITNVSDKFYMDHGCDKRGRLYCRGYHLNYQGTDWNKAVIEFSNKELLDV